LTAKKEKKNTDSMNKTAPKIPATKVKRGAENIFKKFLLHNFNQIFEISYCFELRQNKFLLMSNYLETCQTF
jgi:hypothetical protein